MHAKTDKNLQILKDVLPPMVALPYQHEIDEKRTSLTSDELEVLDLFLSEQHAFSLGTIKREINETTQNKKMSYDKIELIVKSLCKKEILTSEDQPTKSLQKDEEGKPKEAKVKTLYYLNKNFISEWQNRRQELIQFCAKFKHLTGSEILGSALAGFYHLANIQTKPVNLDNVFNR